jgi:hypothetical protein
VDGDWELLIALAAGYLAWVFTTSQIKGVGLDVITRFPLDLLEKIGRQANIQIFDDPGVQAGEVAMGLGTITIEPTMGSIQAFNHTRGLEGFKILIDRCVTDIASKIV